MPEFTPPTFGEEPRKESPGEARVRYASLIRTVAGFLGVKFSEDEQSKLGRFIVDVVKQITPEQQKALAELIGRIGAVIADRYKLTKK
jgi:hypothetical protein